MPAPTSQPPEATPASPSGGDDDKLAQLKLLGELRSSGVLTDEEFTREKNRILDR
jgi:Short C-terminal domain